MKVLMFSGDYWPNIGGIASHVYYLSRALAQNGVKITVIGGHHLPVIEHLSGIDPQNFQEFLIKRQGPKKFRGFDFLFRAALILKRMDSKEWDVVHFHNFIPDGLLLGFANWPKSTIRVYTNHSSALLEALDRGKGISLYKAVTRSVCGIITPSLELMEKSIFIQKSNQKVIYIPNGVDIQLFSPKGSSEDGRHLMSLSVG